MAWFCVPVKQSIVFSENIEDIIALEKDNIQYSEDKTIFFINPAKKLKTSYYRCDTKFHLDNILDMYEDESKISICLISGKELQIYIVTISQDHKFDYKLVLKYDFMLPNKHNKGGQSSVRFERIVEGVRGKYADIISDKIVDTLMINNKTNCSVSKIILAGPSVMKNDVSECASFRQHLKKYLFKIITTNNFSDDAINNIDSIMTDIFREIQSEDVNKINVDIQDYLENKYDNMSFGKDECIKAIKEENITKLFVYKPIVDYNLGEQLNKIKNTLNINVIISDSELIRTYGEWIAIKKYQTVEDFENDLIE